MSARLRPATSEDADHLAGLERALFGVDAWSAGLLAKEVDGAHGTVVVAEDGGAVVGYAVGRRAGDVVDLLRIAVVPPSRRAGLATRLLDAVRTMGREHGAEAVLLEVSATNAAARAFYAAEGFEQIDLRPGYYRDGSDALVLRRECT